MKEGVCVNTYFVYFCSEATLLHIESKNVLQSRMITFIKALKW